MAALRFPADKSASAYQIGGALRTPEILAGLLQLRDRIAQLAALMQGPAQPKTHLRLIGIEALGQPKTLGRAVKISIQHKALPDAREDLGIVGLDAQRFFETFERGTVFVLRNQIETVLIDLKALLGKKHPRKHAGTPDERGLAGTGLPGRGLTQQSDRLFAAAQIGQRTRQIHGGREKLRALFQHRPQHDRAFFPFVLGEEDFRLGIVRVGRKFHLRRGIRLAVFVELGALDRPRGLGRKSGSPRQKRGNRQTCLDTPFQAG